MTVVRRTIKVKPGAAQPAPLAEEAAAQAMWLYYREHKPQLISDISDYRADILARLMGGVAVEEVFAPYFKPAEPAKVPRGAA